MSKVTTTFEAVDTGMVSTINKIERETKSMKDTTEKAEKSVSLSFGAMAKAGAGLAIGIGAIKGAFAALSGTLDNFSQALDMGGRLSDLSSRTGETAGNLLLLERSFDNTGLGADKVGSSINKLQKFMSDANNGTEKNIEVLSNLGIAYSQIANLSPTEQLGMIAERITAINSPTERAAAAMGIFGRAGGELLPMLQNFSGELDNAKSELGSMAGIMDSKSAVFDTVSDKIAVIKGKFTEFAAGLLSNVTPALEMFTTMLAKVDAAGIGQRLTNGAMRFFDVLIGAFHNANEAAATLRNALMYAVKSFGNLIMNSIIDVGNSIGVIMIGGFKIAVNSFKGLMFQAVGASISFLAEKMVSAASLFGEEAEKKARRHADQLISSIRTGSRELATEMQEANNKIGDDMAKMMSENRKSTKDFFGAQGELDKLRESTQKLAEDGKKFREGFMGDDGNPLKPMEKAADRIFLKMRKTGDDVKVMVDKIKELTNIEKLMIELKEAKTGKGTKEEEKQAKELIGAGKFKQAERAIEKVRAKEIEDQIRINEKGEMDKRSIADIAKEEGIKTFGKSKDQLRKEILEKRKGKTLEELEREKEDKKEGKKEPEKKADPLFEMVKAIKDLVAKIEPKLPTHALAL